MRRAVLDNAAKAVAIRSIAASDRADWQSLWTDYLTFYNARVDDAVYDSTFGRLIGDDPQDYSGFVAEQDGQLVGLVHFLFHRHCWKIENVCYLQDLYAAPNVRGSGVGRKLIEAVYQAADTASAPSVYWMTQANNDRARALYDRIAVATDFMKYQRPA